MSAQKICALLLLTALMAGCTTPPPPTDPAQPVVRAPSSAPESSSSVDELASPSVVYQNPADVSSPAAKLTPESMLYLYDADSGIYQKQNYSTPPATLADIVLGVANFYTSTTPVRIRAITQQKGFIVVDFEANSPPAIGVGSSAEHALLNSIAMSLLMSHQDAETICYRIDGEAYESGHLAFGREEAYTPSPLKLVEDTAAAYTALRTQVPFPGISTAYKGYSAPVTFVDDQTARELSWFLYQVGAPEADATSPAALDPKFILKQAVSAAPLLFGMHTQADDSALFPVLAPIVPVVQDSQMTLREHVEAAAQEIFGATAPVTHQDIDGWKWQETAGVYTPPHMGGNLKIPVLFSYEQTESRYRIECAFMHEGMGNYSDDAGVEIPETQLHSAIQSRLRRREYVIERQPNGSLQFVSHRFLS